MAALAQPPTRRQLLARFSTSARVTGRLLVRGQLSLPTDQVGRLLTFADGSRSRIFRETVRHGAAVRQPTLLVVGFRLRFAGRSRFLHAAFRAESIANTPLFAGFAGFRSKLWLTDEHGGVYRGIYQWDGASRAETYASTLARLLRPVCVPHSVKYHIEPGIIRDDFLRDPAVVDTGDTAAADRWWRLRSSEQVPA